MSIFPRLNQRTKIILPIRSNLATYNKLPEITEITTNTFIPSIEDGPTVVARYRNLTISNGATLTTSHRCCGLVVVVEGDLTIGATSSLSMTARGANFVPTGNHLIKNDLLPAKDVVYEIDIPATADEIAAFLKAEKRRYHHVDELPAIYRPSIYALAPTGVFTPEVLGEVPIVGGAGGASVLNAAGVPGVSGTNRGCGGGGSGGAYYLRSGKGSSGTCYSGGSGSGGAADSSNTGLSSGDAQGYGGYGSSGVGSTFPAGGGAGNPGGSGGGGSPGENGTGGLLIVICLGTLTNKGIISAHGSAGGNGWASSGGSSGGGSINIFYQKSDVVGVITATGGVSPTPGGTYGGKKYRGGDGGAGCVTLDQYNF